MNVIKFPTNKRTENERRERNRQAQRTLQEVYAIVVARLEEIERKKEWKRARRD